MNLGIGEAYYSEDILFLYNIQLSWQRLNAASPAKLQVLRFQ